MIPARFSTILFSFILSLFMSFVVSGIATYSAIGFIDEFVVTWMTSWRSWLVAFPTVLVVAPLTRKIVGKLTTAS